MGFVEWVLVGFFVGTILFFVIGVPLYIYYGRMWFRAQAAGAPVAFFEMFAMTARKQPAHKLVPAFLEIHRAGQAVPLYRIVEMHNGGVDMPEISRAIKIANSNGTKLLFEDACSLALRGVEVDQHVEDVAEEPA